jgi:hypothetical protein
MMYSKVRDLPTSLQRALSSVGYGRPDIGIRTALEESVACPGGSGYCGFAVIVDMSTGETRKLVGSWGGANMFNQDNRVDLDTQPHTMLPNVAVITGHIGGDRPTYATITIHPDNTVKMLPAVTELTTEEAYTLTAFGYIGEYRKRMLARHGSALDTLVSKGLVKRNKAGACSITTEGRNAKGLAERIVRAAKYGPENGGEDLDV